MDTNTRWITAFGGLLFFGLLLYYYRTPTVPVEWIGPCTREEIKTITESTNQPYPTICINGLDQCWYRPVRIPLDKDAVADIFEEFCKLGHCACFPNSVVDPVCPAH